jgi:glycosyltransferase involved in cell wall biosynthesis
VQLVATVKLSVVIPVFRNEASLGELVARLAELAGNGELALEAVFVVDGSPDRSADLLRETLPQAGLEAQVLSLSRNFGSFAAIRAGLDAASGDLLAVMAADLQEPPELVLELARKLRREELDVGVGIRAARRDPLLTRWSSALFWRTYRRLVLPEVPANGVDVFACTRAFRDHLLLLRESRSTLIGLLFWLGFRRGEIVYERAPRRHGRSAWSLRRRVRYMMDSVFAFTDLPLRILEAIGLAGMATAVLVGLVILTARFGGQIPVPGYAATAVLILFFGGLNAFGLGLIGEYVARAFENTKARPQWVVAERWSFPSRADGSEQR